MILNKVTRDIELFYTYVNSNFLTSFFFQFYEAVFYIISLKHYTVISTRYLHIFLRNYFKRFNINISILIHMLLIYLMNEVNTI